MSAENRKVSIIGSGLIGKNWAMIFSSFGFKACLYDTNKDCLNQAKQSIRQELEDLCSKNLARGSLSLEQRLDLILTTDSLSECLKDTDHIQECVFEDLALKQDIFEQVDRVLDPANKHAAICSSTSVQMPSKVYERVSDAHSDQCLNAHPINPPLHVRLVELVPTSRTSEDIITKTRDLMEFIGQKPVILRKEISGFALNRIQFAVFQEAYRLIHDGVMSTEDVDTVVTEGLGPRYAFIGPWMNGHLNAVGLGDYLSRYNEGIYAVSKECHPLLKIEGETAQEIVDTMTRVVPIDKLNEKRAWRDTCLIELSKVKDATGDGKVV